MLGGLSPATSRVLTVLAVLLVPVTYCVLWRTAFGLRLRSCGENPVAAESLGVQRLPVQVRRRDRLRRARRPRRGLPRRSSRRHLPRGPDRRPRLHRPGRMIFGNWRPGGLAAGAGLFGYTDALQLRSGGDVRARCCCSLARPAGRRRGLPGRARRSCSRRRSSRRSSACSSLVWLPRPSTRCRASSSSFTPHLGHAAGARRWRRSGCGPPAADGLAVPRGED